MTHDRLQSLRERASLALRSHEFEDAIVAYRELERVEPRNPIWPRRRAEALAGMGEVQAGIEVLQSAAERAIDEGHVIQAIAICKHILTLDPDNLEIQDRLHLLYSEPLPARTPAPMDEGGSEPPLEPETTPAPDLSRSAALDEVLLTEIIPGATSAGVEDASDLEVAEIQLDPPAEGSRAREQLLQTPLFGSLDAETLRSLIAQAWLVDLSENQVLFRQGDAADALYVIAEGAVVPIAEGDPPKKLAVLEAGSFFGEIGLVTNRPRNATIQAIVDSRLLAIDRRAMWSLIREKPEVLKVMVRFLRDRSIDRLIRTNPFFQAFPSDKRPAVAKLFRFLEARDGTTLISQGTPASNLYAIVTGSVDIIRTDPDGDKTLATLRPGMLFGEISLLRAEPAVAGAIARGKCWLMALSRDRLAQLIKYNPGAGDMIESLANARENRNRQAWAAPYVAPEEPIGPI